MENNNPADLGGRRRGAELVDQIAAYIPRLQSLEEYMMILIQAIECMGIPANATHAKVTRIYKLFKIVKMGGQNMNPRFRRASVVIAVALGIVKCGLLMYILLGDMPWPIIVLCILMAFTFIVN